jgi:transcriptional regulator GlxA family with amidase domain
MACSAGRDRSMSDLTTPLDVAIVLFDGVEELDFVGPWEVFTMARQIGGPIEAFTLGWPDKSIHCAKGLHVEADHALAAAPPADLVIVPGGKGTRTLAKNQPFIDQLRAYLAAAKFQASVCTGSGLLGRAGFLDHRKATTNRHAFDFFRETAPKAELIEDRRYVRDGSVFTSAGVSAGIDMSLWLVGLLLGEKLARDTQKYMEYYPEPPYGNA